MPRPEEPSRRRGEKATCPKCGEVIEREAGMCPVCSESLYETREEIARVSKREAFAGDDANKTWSDLSSQVAEMRKRQARRSSAPSSAEQGVGEQPAEVFARVLISSALPDPVRLSPGRAAQIGRSRVCDVVLAHGAVSRLHAEIAEQDGFWRVTDLGSPNGVYVNGERVLRHVLQHRDRLRISCFELSYKELGAEEARALLWNGHAADAEDTAGFDGDDGLSGRIDVPPGRVSLRPVRPGRARARGARRGRSPSVPAQALWG